MDEQHSSVPPINHRIPKACGALVIFIACSVALGWMLQINLLQNFFPHWITMKFNTAINFIFCGTALLLLTRQRKSARFNEALIKILGILIFSIGLVSLIESIFKVNFDIDQLFILDKTILEKNRYPGRMSIMTAISFIFCSQTFIFAFFRKNYILIYFLALIAIFEIINFIFSGSQVSFYSLQKYGFFYTSIQTVTLFLILSIGIIFLKTSGLVARIYLSHHSGGILARYALPFIVIAPIIINYLRIIGQLGNWYSVESGVALMVTIIILSSLVFLFYFAKKLNEIDTIRWKNENLLKAILDNTDSFIYIKDPQGKYILINKHYEDYFQLKNTNVIGKTDLEFFPKTIAKEFIINDEKAYKEKKPILVEEIAIINNKQHVYLSNKFPIFNEYAEIYAIAGISTEITEKRAFEEEKTKLANIVYCATDAIIGKDLNGIINSWNPAAEKLYGYSKEEAINNSIFIIVPESKKIEIDYLMEQIEKGGVITNYITERKTKLGKIIPVSVTLFPIKNHAGKIVGASSITRDISEEKQRDYELLITNERLHAIINGSNHSIISTDLNGVIKMFNPAAERMLGVSAEEVINKETPEIFHDHEEIKNRAEVLTKELGRTVNPGFEVFVAKLADQTVDEHEWTYIHKNGKRFPVLLSATAMHGVNNELIGYVGIGQDITERKKMDAMKSEFISIVSHELRTPLTSIYGSLSILSQTLANQLSAENQNLINIAKRNSERLVLLINDILDIEKIESGKMKFTHEQVDINLLVKESINENLPYATQYNVKLNLKNTLKDGYISTDKNRLMQVMTNLLSNAIKFSPQGSEVIVNIDQRENNVRVSIIDKGPGISEEFKAKIFQKFEQADTSTTRERGGTGLGLSICKIIITKLGGSIGFESQKNLGSTFYFELPLLIK